MPPRGPKPRKKVWCKECSSYYNIPKASAEPKMCPECRNKVWTKRKRDASKDRKDN